MKYLHEHDIVHGDLKAVGHVYISLRTNSKIMSKANVMVDSSGHAKLIDFGFSRIIDTVTGISGGITMTTVAFSVRWCAPELLLSAHAQVTKAADVYALASTALQVRFACHYPFLTLIPLLAHHRRSALWVPAGKVDSFDRFESRTT